MDLSVQKPEYQDIKIDDEEVENFLNKKFPLIQQVAKKLMLTSHLKMKLV